MNRAPLCAVVMLALGCGNPNAPQQPAPGGPPNPPAAFQNNTPGEPYGSTTPGQPMELSEEALRWIELLRAEESGATQRAVLALRDLDADHVALLEHALADKDSLVRMRAAAILAQHFDHGEAVQALVAALDGEWDIREEAFRALQHVGARAVFAARPALERALRDERPFVQVGAAFALCRINKYGDAVPVLAERLRDPGPFVRRLSARALVGRIFWARIHVEFTVQTLADNSYRSWAFDPEACEFRSAIPTFRAALCDPDPLVRGAAAEVLTTVGGPRELPVFVEMLEHPDADIRKASASALAKLGPLADRAAGALKETLNDEDTACRIQAAVAYCRVRGDGAALPILRKAAEDPDCGTRYRLASTLYSSQVGKGGIEILIRLLADSEASIRSYAAQTLGQIGPAAAPAAQALTNALKDDSEDVRKEAAFALAAVDPSAEEAVPALIDLLKEGNESLREDVVEALGTPGLDAKTAVPALVEALEDPAPMVQRRAAESLGELGPDAAAAIPALTNLLRQGLDDRWTRVEITTALAKIDSKAAARMLLTRLRAELHHGEDAQQDAMYFLGSLGREAAPAVPQVLSILDDPTEDENTRWGAALTLKKIALPAEVDPEVARLVEDFEGGDEQTRGEALMLLSSLGPVAKSAFPKLANKANEFDQSGDFDFHVAGTLISIDREAAAKHLVPLLIAQVNKADPDDRRAALKFLAELGPLATAAVPRLRQVFEDETAPWTLRDQAYHALWAIESEPPDVEGE